ncbi:extracellular solute-binding protein [Neglecta sp. X4]|uniref:ABC transporter substrate-binding protein n=1 Tax=unclassified Neglectibacter TaxID=2632164 RepID=UPI00136CE6FF|nr:MULTISPECIES: extracellular solute-binding protein [unclassified Neglectibacter]NBI18891.1 extracellular solute-binding protein [Neglectibacter sp. 59]NBJ74510.1 extracellular solute-binding protein [Neglectibacter sp. X4]NCE82343.1 extracellular solute-binding protein [Neglectibacter sp. X58]
MKKHIRIYRCFVCLLFAMSLITISGCETASPKEPIREKEVSQGVDTDNSSETLTILTVYQNDELTRLIKEFESVHQEVDIEVEVGIRSSADVGRLDSWDNFMEELAVNLMSGDGPDILVDPGVFTPLQYHQSGVVYDLREWMDQDQEFHLEDYYENLFQAYEIEGKQYTVPTRVSLNVVYLNKTLCDIAEKSFSPWDTLDYTEVLDIWKSADQFGAISPDFTLEFMDQRGKCNLFIDAELPDFVDVQAGTSSFDSPEFIQYLQDTKGIPSNRAASEIMAVTGGNVLEQFALTNEEKNTSLLLIDTVGVETLRNVLQVPENCVGPLFLTSRKGNISFTPALASLVVPKSCSNPDLAWEFLKFCIAPVDEPAYYSIYHPKGSVDIIQGNTLPIAQKNLRSYGELYGKVGSVLEKDSQITVDFDPTLIESPFSDGFFEQVDQVLSLYKNPVDSLGRLGTIYTPILQQYYDKGTLSAEACAKSIQQKAGIWLRE